MEQEQLKHEIEILEEKIEKTKLPALKRVLEKELLGIEERFLALAKAVRRQAKEDYKKIQKALTVTPDDDRLLKEKEELEDFLR